MVHNHQSDKDSPTNRDDNVVTETQRKRRTSRQYYRYYRRVTINHGDWVSFLQYKAFIRTMAYLIAGGILVSVIIVITKELGELQNLYSDIQNSTINVTDGNHNRKPANANKQIKSGTVDFILKNSIIENLPRYQGRTPNYLVGVGRADITGPAADVNMMGYANPEQLTGGIHMRQYARTFIIGQGSSRFVFVSLDACMGSMLVKLEVLKMLKSYYGNLYRAENLCISATHTHSAPAGFLQDVLFQITSKGYVPETLHAMVTGIVKSIQIAHDNLAPGYLQLNKGELLKSNINRSPVAYLNNPERERKRYAYNVDKEMVLLKILDASGKGLGMINWFPVHCTSMNNTNSLISGDNKGYASLLFEKEMDPDSLVGRSTFVAAFAQANEGDVSPNTKGPHCIDTGLPCDTIHSTCSGTVQNCVASGPGRNMFESTQIIGRNQFQKALSLYKESSTFLTGPVQFVHQYIDMTNQTVSINSTHTAHTCKPAMGFSFAAGTTDGPGMFDFQQGDTKGNAFWKLVGSFLQPPSQAQVKCHAPKPILLDTGEMKFPYLWQPQVVDTQILRIGQLLIAAVPGEFSTMSGRRIQSSVLDAFTGTSSHQHKRPGTKTSEPVHVVIAGLSNTYADYITTYEEYQIQRYEGASTIYGPHTLEAYEQQYRHLARLMKQGKKPDNSTKANDDLENLLTFVPGVVFDNTPAGRSFGDVLKQANKNYTLDDVVSVQFVAGNPRNSPNQNMSFLSIERLINKHSWEVIHTDADWDTKFIWGRSSPLGDVSGISEATIEWQIPSTTSSGYYRLNHFGHYKNFWNQQIYSYQGQSDTFYVTIEPKNK